MRGRIEARSAHVGVIGLGYVGLPVALAFHAARFPVLGFDIDPAKVKRLVAGDSYIGSVPAGRIRAVLDQGGFEATGDFSRLREADAIVICVPTPLDRNRNPDLSFVTGTADTVAANLRAGQLVCLESTTYPGTTDEVLRPRFEARGLRVGRDVFLAYSPEREDPGNREFDTRSIPKVIGADDPDSLEVARTLYAAAIQSVVPVSSTRTAEAVKITENVYRAVNIALVNELKLVYDAMGIDIWEVIEAAKTKPFGFSPFYPGPGLGGHCVPIDPFYLTWKAREFGVESRFIELSGIINQSMPEHVIDRLESALHDRQGIALSGARILILGTAYKKNVDDTRESPALRIMESLERRGAHVEYHDPHVPIIPSTREHPDLAGRASTPLNAAALRGFQAVVICVDHDAVDWRLLVESVPLVVDTRNVVARQRIAADHVLKA